MLPQKRGINLETMILRSPHPLLLVFGALPFRRWNSRSSLSLPKIAPIFDSRSASSPQALPFFSPVRSQYGGQIKSVRVFSRGPGTGPAGDEAASPAIASLVTNSAHRPKDKFCQYCGSLTKQVIPDGDEKMRAVCTACGRIHYENPKMVVGCLVEQDGKVLLCKRNIHPSYGLWTLPAGYLEIGESAVEGATRETFEEANAEVEVISPFVQLDIPHIGQYRAISYSEQK